MNEEQRIEQLLDDLEHGRVELEAVLEETKIEQSAIFEYLFLDEHQYLTEREKDQLLFLHAVLWNLRKTDVKIDMTQVEDMEEGLWTEKEAGLFPFETAHPKMEALSDDIFALVLDCSDEEDHALTTAGSEWIQVKGFTIACLLCRE